MSTDEAVRLALVLLIIGGAAVVKGMTGFGFPLVAAPLISMALDARSAVIILSIVSIFGNFGIMVRGGGSRPTFRRLVPMLAGMVIGTIVGAQLVATVDPLALGAVVGICTLTFAIVSLARPGLAVPTRVERYVALPMGLLSGLLGGSTSMFAPIAVPYLHALHLAKREFVFFVTLLYTIAGAVQIVSYAQLGLYDGRTLLIIGAALIPNAVGISLGLRLQDRIHAVAFHRLVLALVAVTGASLVARGVWG